MRVEGTGFLERNRRKAALAGCCAHDRLAGGNLWIELCQAWDERGLPRRFPRLSLDGVFAELIGAVAPQNLNRNLTKLPPATPFFGVGGDHLPMLEVPLAS